jgi:hypothetical protein
MNILEQARGIIYDKSEEKERQYGDFFENMEDAAKIASVMSKKQLTAEDIYHALIGLKFARESYTHKHDNMLDAIAYLASLHEYKESKTVRAKENFGIYNIVENIEVVDPVVVKSKKKDSKTLLKKNNGLGRDYWYTVEIDDENPSEHYAGWCNTNTGTVDMSFAHMTEV